MLCSFSLQLEETEDTRQNFDKSKYKLFEYKNNGEKKNTNLQKHIMGLKSILVLNWPNTV